MLKDFSKLFTPMISFIAIVLASSLLTTLLPIRLQSEGVSEFVIGIVSSALYIGITIGAFKIEAIVSRIGHIRAYTAFAGLLTASTLLMGLYYSAIFWFLLRLIVGYCMSGIFIVIESWVLASGPTQKRGKLLSIYMVSMYAAQSGGQFLLGFGNIKSLELFALVAVLMVLSTVPLALTRMNSPIVHEPSALKLSLLYKVSPSGMLGAFVSGIILSCVYSLIPLFISKTTYGVESVPLVMGSIIFGGMVLQYPMGKFSDYFDRRKMILLICLAISGASLALMFTTGVNLNLFILLCIIFGGFTFTLYPLSISHTCDFVSQDDIVAATQGLLLSYGIGAILGPTLASICMSFGTNGLFFFMSLVSLGLAIFIYKRSILGRNPMNKSDFVLSSITTPVAGDMNARLQIENDKNAK